MALPKTSQVPLGKAREQKTRLSPGKSQTSNWKDYPVIIITGKLTGKITVIIIAGKLTGKTTIKIITGNLIGKTTWLSLLLENSLERPPSYHCHWKNQWKDHLYHYHWKTHWKENRYHYRWKTHWKAGNTYWRLTATTKTKKTSKWKASKHPLETTQTPWSLETVERQDTHWRPKPSPAGLVTPTGETLAALEITNLCTMFTEAEPKTTTGKTWVTLEITNLRNASRIVTHWKNQNPTGRAQYA